MTGDWHSGGGGMSTGADVFRPRLDFLFRGRSRFCSLDPSRGSPIAGGGCSWHQITEAAAGERWRPRRQRRYSCMAHALASLFFFNDGEWAARRADHPKMVATSSAGALGVTEVCATIVLPQDGGGGGGEGHGGSAVMRRIQFCVRGSGQAAQRTDHPRKVSTSSEGAVGVTIMRPIWTEDAGRGGQRGGGGGLPAVFQTRAPNRVCGLVAVGMSKKLYWAQRPRPLPLTPAGSPTVRPQRVCRRGAHACHYAPADVTGGSSPSLREAAT